MAEKTAPKSTESEQAEILQAAEALFFKTKVKLSQNTLFKDELSFKYLCALTTGPLNDARVGIKAEEKGYEKCVASVGNTGSTLFADFTILNSDLSPRSLCNININLGENDSHIGADIAYEDRVTGEHLSGLAAAAKFGELLEKIK
jgi:hypothetical protein